MSTMLGTCTRFWTSVFLIANSVIGAGFLNFPAAFRQAGGIVVALTIQLVILIFVVGAVYIMATCSDLNSSDTYQNVVHGMCGNVAKFASSLNIALYCFGSSVTYTIIIGDQFDRALASLYGSDFCHTWYLNRYFTISMSMLVFALPLCFSKKIDFLKYASTIGTMSIIYLVFLIVYKYKTGSVTPDSLKTTPDHWTDVFLAVPVMCFSYECHISSIPIYACLEQRRIASFMWMNMVAMAIVSLIYTIGGTFGFLTFGDHVFSDILSNYDAADPLVLLGIVMVAIKMIASYPIPLFCGRSSVDDMYSQATGHPPDVAVLSESKRHSVIVILWFVASVTIAITTPSISVIIQLFGSLAVTLIFIFPGLCLLFFSLNRENNKPRIEYLTIFVALVFIVVGSFLSGLVVAQFIQKKTWQQKSVTRGLCNQRNI